MSARRVRPHPPQKLISPTSACPAPCLPCPATQTPTSAMAFSIARSMSGAPMRTHTRPRRASRSFTQEMPCSCGSSINGQRSAVWEGAGRRLLGCWMGTLGVGAAGGLIQYSSTAAAGIWMQQLDGCRARPRVPSMRSSSPRPANAQSRACLAVQPLPPELVRMAPFCTDVGSAGRPSRTQPATSASSTSSFSGSLRPGLMGTPRARRNRSQSATSRSLLGAGQGQVVGWGELDSCCGAGAAAAATTAATSIGRHTRTASKDRNLGRDLNEPSCRPGEPT